MRDTDSGVTMASYLSPWDALPYFETPRELSFTFGPGMFLAIPRNVQRVSIVISNAGPGTFILHLDPNAIAGSGIILLNGQNIRFNHHDDGPLTQVEWWVGSAALGNTISWFEVVLSKWPQKADIGG